MASAMKKAGAAGIAAMMAVGAMAPAAAFAAGEGVSGYADVNGDTGSTKFEMVADNSAMSLRVPTRVVVAVQGGGTLVGPSAEANYIQNDSVFNAHVAQIATSLEEGFSWEEAADNSLELTLTPAGGAAADLSSTVTVGDGSWNIAKGGGKLGMETGGSISNVTKDISESTEFATVNWTFAAGDWKAGLAAYTTSLIGSTWYPNGGIDGGMGMTSHGESVPELSNMSMFWAIPFAETGTYNVTVNATSTHLTEDAESYVYVGRSNYSDAADTYGCSVTSGDTEATFSGNSASFSFTVEVTNAGATVDLRCGNDTGTYEGFEVDNIDVIIQKVS